MKYNVFEMVAIFIQALTQTRLRAVIFYGTTPKA